MAYRLEELPQAKLELEQEVRYLLQYSERAAAKLLDDYEAKMDLLASGILTQEPSVEPALASLGYYKALVGDGHLVLYYLEGDALVVAHFCSTRQDYARLL